jgi:glycosyltransferase involved in cell wall biosynthesis
VQDDTINTAADTRVARDHRARDLRVLVVTGGTLREPDALATAAHELAAAGASVTVAAPAAPAVDGLRWYPTGADRRHLAPELAAVARDADVVLTDPRTVADLRRLRTPAAIVLVADEELLGRRARRLRHARVDLAVATADAVAAPLRWLGIDTVVVPPVVTPPPGAAREPGATHLIGCATRFEDGAGLDVLLDAFAALARPGLRLEIVNVGRTTDERVVSALRARAARPDLEGRVDVAADGVAPDEARARIRHWQVAVAPNVAADGAASPLREAVALGVPAVATDRGGNAEAVGDRGILVRPGRAGELRDALARALDDDDLRRRVARAAADTGEARRTGRDLVAVLEDAARRAARRRAGTIVFVVPDYEPTLGGTTRQTRNQARELHARGYDVLVLTQRLQAHWPRSEVRDGIRLRRLGPSGRTSLRMKLLVLAVAWWLRRHRDEIAVVNAIMYPDFVVSAALAGLAERTVMCWAGLGDATDTLGRSGALRAPLRAIRRRALMRGAQVALTPALADELDGLGLSRDVNVIPTPVDIEAFQPPPGEQREQARRDLGVRDDELVIAYTGHLRALKRVERLVEAFRLLVESGRPARLLLVGSPRQDLADQPVALTQQLERLPRRDLAIVTGAVADVRPYLYAADAFVLPSDREGLSNSVLEALATGLPVVAPASAAGDQVLDDTCGIVPDSNDPEELFAALTELANDTDYRRRLAKGARLAAERFALDRVVNEYEGMYARLRRSESVR